MHENYMKKVLGKPKLLKIKENCNNLHKLHKKGKKEDYHVLGIKTKTEDKEQYLKSMNPFLHR